MRNRLVLIAAIALLVTITGCAVRFSAEVRNPWHPDVYQRSGNTAKPPAK